MEKKPGKLSAAPSGKRLAETLTASATTIWLAGLGAFSNAQNEGGKLFEALIAEGQAVQRRAVEMAQETLSNANSKTTRALDNLEQGLEGRAERALKSIHLPTRGDIDRLSKQLEELSKVTAKLSHGIQGGGKKFP